MVSRNLKLHELRPGMEHVDFRLTVTKLAGIRKVKTYSGVEHSILEGEASDNVKTISFAIWNEKISLINDVNEGDIVDFVNCFITSFKGILQINVGRDSNALKVKSQVGANT